MLNFLWVILILNTNVTWKNVKIYIFFNKLYKLLYCSYWAVNWINSFWSSYSKKFLKNMHNEHNCSLKPQAKSQIRELCYLCTTSKSFVAYCLCSVFKNVLIENLIYCVVVLYKRQSQIVNRMKQFIFNVTI